MNMQSIQSLTHTGAAGHEVKATRQTAAPAAVQNTPEPRQTGALRLLQEGHFKGVADARLRINLHEEILALNQAGQAAVAREGGPELAAAVGTEIDALLAAGVLPEEASGQVSAAFSSFSVEIEMRVEIFNEGSSSPGRLAADLQTAFESLRDILDPLLTALAGSEGIGGSASAGSSTDMSGFLGKLANVFDEALTALMDKIEAIEIVPPVSDPSGKGVAFARFTDILAAMNTAPEAQDNVPMNLSA
jgi:hypothetical protein